MQKYRLNRCSKSGEVISFGGEIQKSGILQNVFWALIEFESDISFDEILDGPTPALVTFFRNKNIYHLIPGVGDGIAEIRSAKDLERDTASMRNGQIDTDVLEKFILVASYFSKKILPEKNCMEKFSILISLMKADMCQNYSSKDCNGSEK